jgi:hypothetical protein
MNASTAEFSSLEPNDRVEWLLNLSFGLTIAAREEYLDAGSYPIAAFNALRCYNELAHQITGQLLKISSGQEETAYPYVTFLDALRETAQKAKGEEQLRRAMARATEWLGK